MPSQSATEQQINVDRLLAQLKQARERHVSMQYVMGQAKHLALAAECLQLAEEIEALEAAALDAHLAWMNMRADEELEAWYASQEARETALDNELCLNERG